MFEKKINRGHLTDLNLQVRNPFIVAKYKKINKHIIIYFLL